MHSQNSKHDIVKVLEHYGFTIPSNRGGWVTVRCAFHNDKVKSARLNIDNGGNYWRKQQRTTKKT